MKKLKLDAIFFIFIITVLGAANLLNFNKPKISVLENRTLKQKPQFTWDGMFGGGYSKSYEDYYSDTFILRESMVKASRDFQQAMNFLGPNVTLVTSAENLQVPEETGDGDNTQADEEAPETAVPSNQPTGDASPAPSQPTPPATPSKQPNKDFGDGQNVGYWLVVDGKAVQLFKFNKESFEYYSQVLNKYGEKLGSGVKIYSMIPPTTGEFLKLKKYKGITDSQDDALGFLESKLDDRITLINVFDALNRHKDEYIYFKTDHHWTALGAYYAYASFMEATGRQPSDLKQYETVDLGTFLGSSYTKTLDKSLEKNPDNVTAFKPFTQYEYVTYYGNEEKKADVIDMKYADEINNKYLAFMSSGGATWSVVKTNVHNGKKLLLIKDSFGNAIAPFMLPHYEEIYVVDPRFYSIKTTGKSITQFIGENGINEVLFCIYMEDANWHKFMSSVENLLGD